MYDVGLIKLKTPLDLDSPQVSTVQLPETYSEPSGEGVIAGWGSTTASMIQPIYPDILQTVDLTIIDRDVCQEVLDTFSQEISQKTVRQTKFPLFVTSICTGPIIGGIHPCSVICLL